MNQDKNINDLMNQLKETRKVASQAMAYSSYLGSVLRFMEQSFICHDERELIHNLLSVCSSLSLDCIAKYSLEEDEFTLSISTAITDDENTLFEKARERARIYSEENVTILSFDHVSLFVRNMPINDDYKYGIMKDIIATLLNGVESRMKAIHKDQRILSTQKDILDITNKLITEFNSSVSKFNENSFQKISDTLSDIKNAIMTLDVNNESEKDITEMLNSHTSLIKDMSTEGVRVDKYFKSIKYSLENIVTELEEEKELNKRNSEPVCNNDIDVELF